MLAYPDTPYSPEFKKLGAIVGFRKLQAPDKWLEWNRLVDEFTWDTVLAAARRCAPDDRWANGVEKMCMEIRRQEAATKKQAAQDAANAALKVKASARLVKVDGRWVVEEARP